MFLYWSGCWVHVDFYVMLHLLPIPVLPRLVLCPLPWPQQSHWLILPYRGLWDQWNKNEMVSVQWIPQTLWGLSLLSRRREVTGCFLLGTTLHDHVWSFVMVAFDNVSMIYYLDENSWEGPSPLTYVQRGGRGMDMEKLSNLCFKFNDFLILGSQEIGYHIPLCQWNTHRGKRLWETR